MPTRDLTHPLDAGTWTYPGDPPVSVEPHATITEDGYRVSALSLGTHAGTHLDAPSHTEANGATVDELPVEAFAFDAALVRLSDEMGPRESIEPSRLSSVPDDCDCLVIDTGWAAHWGSDDYLDNPYLTEEAASVCADRGLAVALVFVVTAVVVAFLLFGLLLVVSTFALVLVAVDRDLDRFGVAVG